MLLSSSYTLQQLLRRILPTYKLLLNTTTTTYFGNTRHTRNQMRLAPSLVLRERGLDPIGRRIILPAAKVVEFKTIELAILGIVDN